MWREYKPLIKESIRKSVRRDKPIEVQPWRYNDVELDKIIRMLKKYKAEKLNIYCEKILSDPTYIHFINRINGIKSITHLELSGKMSKRIMIFMFQELQKNKSIKYLKLSCFPEVKNSISEFIKLFTYNDTISSVIFGGSDLLYENLLFRGFAVNSTVKEIDISGHKIKQIKNITASFLPPTGGPGDYCIRKQDDAVLEVLKLNSCMLSKECIHDISVFLSRSKTIKTLELKNNSIDSDSVKFLSRGLSKNKSLESLDLSNNKLLSRDIPILSEGILSNNTLRRLSLKKNGLGEGCANYLIRIMNKLEVVNIAKIKVGISGMNQIMESLLSNSIVKELNISDNNFHSHGMILGDIILNNKSLKVLEFSHINPPGGRQWEDIYRSELPEYFQKLEYSFSQNNTLEKLDIKIISDKERAGDYIISLRNNSSVSTLLFDYSNEKRDLRVLVEQYDEDIGYTVEDKRITWLDLVNEMFNNLILKNVRFNVYKEDMKINHFTFMLELNTLLFNYGNCTRFNSNIIESSLLKNKLLNFVISMKLLYGNVPVELSSKIIYYYILDLRFDINCWGEYLIS